MKKISQGFTLIEIMVVIAIIGLMAAIAIPMYQDYITRAKLSEVFSVATGVKARVVESYSLQGICPVNSGSGTEVAPTDYATSIIQEINVTNSSGACDINVKIKSNAALASAVKGKTIILQLDSTNLSGSFSWICTSDMSASDTTRYLPKACQ